MAFDLKPTQLTDIATERALEEKKKQEEKERQRREEQARIRDEFFDGEIPGDWRERLGRRLSDAAARGQTSIMIGHFPSDWCTDSGRAINSGRADWPDTLQGDAKTGYETYLRELKPLGYKLEARIINFPNGMPGDVGLYLSW